MAKPTTVRSDENGLFLRTDGRIFRPGAVTGVVMADMSDGGLAPGDKVQARHVSGTTRCRVTLPDGRVLLWHNEYHHQREAEMLRERAAMLASGITPGAAILRLLQPARVERGEDDDGYQAPKPR